MSRKKEKMEIIDEAITKFHLQRERIDRWRGKLIKSGLDPLQSAWWSSEDHALEKDVWIEADAYYEEKKNELRTQLKALSSVELESFFSENNIEPQNIDAYLPVSPAKV